MGEARKVLSPVLTERIPFRTLDRIGEQIGAGPIPPTRVFLRSVAQLDVLGGWPVIGSALAQQIDRDPQGTLRACRDFIVGGGKWFITDILAERVLGRALTSGFEANLARLVSWRQDPDRWVRRAVGVGIHSWAKWSRGAVGLEPQVVALLGFLEPLFVERELDAVKGIGWGLKTIGRFYPDRLARWLSDQRVIEGRPYRRLMLRKALTYLSEEQRAYVQGDTQSP
jgi:hypothetical protein